MLRLLVLLFVPIVKVTLAQECKEIARPTNKCTGHVIDKITQEEINEILRFHEYVRDKLRRGVEEYGSPGPQKRASSLKNLKWNHDLATKAQEYVNQCPENRELDPCRFKLHFGQNVGKLEQDNVIQGKNFEMREILHDWYSGVNHLNRNEIHSYQEQNFTNVGEYTQMVWSRSTRIGCAVLKRIFSTGYIVHLVCNYREPGNVVGKPVFIAADEANANDHPHPKQYSLCQSTTCNQRFSDSIDPIHPPIALPVHPNIPGPHAALPTYDKTFSEILKNLWISVKTFVIKLLDLGSS